jgi:hypothetical protein
MRAYRDDSPWVRADFGIAIILAAIAISPGASQGSGSGTSGRTIARSEPRRSTGQPDEGRRTR